jgi:hypothetical protein
VRVERLSRESAQLLDDLFFGAGRGEEAVFAQHPSHRLCQHIRKLGSAQQYEEILHRLNADVMVLA